MKRLRLVFLLTALFAVLFTFYYTRVDSVRVEKVMLKSALTGKVLPYNAILPRGYDSLFARGKSYPVLYLLHGHGGNYSSWIAHTGLVTYVAAFNLIVVTPEGSDGWYSDSATIENAKNETAIIKELIPDVESRFRVVSDRRARAIAGNSMGGYGAMKFGLKHPELFAFVASMSGAFDASRRDDEASIRQTFGPLNNANREANDLEKLASLADSKTLPYFYFDCGKEDPWLGANRALDDVFNRQKIVHDYREVTGGHDWACWDRQVREVLKLAASKVNDEAFR